MSFSSVLHVGWEQNRKNVFHMQEIMEWQRRLKHGKSLADIYAWKCLQEITELFIHYDKNFYFNLFLF